MCAIIGVIPKNQPLSRDVMIETKTLLYRSRDRGRDSWGVGFTSGKEYFETKELDFKRIKIPLSFDILIGNTRAEPTTEFVRHKTREDVHPFSNKDYSVVHNGIVCNDKELRQKLKIKTMSKIDSSILPYVFSKCGYKESIQSFLKGSFALLTIDLNEPKTLLAYRDYKPLFMRETKDAIYFASKPEYFLTKLGIVEIPPYSFVKVINNKVQIEKTIRDTNNKAYVICSGGLDSTTAAAFAKNIYGYDITLIYFTYGCRAEKHEIKAVKNIAKYLNCDYQLIDLSFLKSLGGNPLIDKKLKIAKKEIGAEYAHEWVPFRNGLMIAMAASLCDRYNVGKIFLGLNLEEGGAYPDNTEEFYQSFNKVLALGSISRPIIINPLGNLMKHEIVKLAFEINAPIHLSWSCYEQKTNHCGECGPCYMRKKAFKMNNIKEVVKYEK